MAPYLSHREWEAQLHGILSKANANIESLARHVHPDRRPTSRRTSSSLDLGTEATGRTVPPPAPFVRSQLIFPLRSSSTGDVVDASSRKVSLHEKAASEIRWGAVEAFEFDQHKPSTTQSSSRQRLDDPSQSNSIDTSFSLEARVASRASRDAYERLKLEKLDPVEARLESQLEATRRESREIKFAVDAIMVDVEAHKKELSHCQLFPPTVHSVIDLMLPGLGAKVGNAHDLALDVLKHELEARRSWFARVRRQRVEATQWHLDIRAG